MLNKEYISGLVSAAFSIIGLLIVGCAIILLCTMKKTLNKPDQKKLITPEYYLDFQTQTCYAHFPGSWTYVPCTKEILDVIK